MPEFAKIPAWAQELNVGHLGEYFGPWAILAEALEASLARVQQINLQLHVAEYRETPPRVSGASRDYAMAPGGVAVIDLRGPLMKQASSFSGGTSTVQARRQIRDAAADDDIAAIMLRIDSPGGTVAGSAELGDEIARAAAKKPLDAFIDDLGASGAYWAASQARRIYTQRTGVVGSIGAYGVIVDSSGKAAQQGLRVHVVRAGEMKGAGYPGTEINADVLADRQRLIDDLNEHFLRAVAAGRRMTISRVRELADGRVHVGAAAVELGLVDGLASFDEALGAVTASASPKPRSRRMSAETQPAANSAVEATARTDPAGQPASFHALTNALPGADAEFICRQMAANATVAQATAAWMAELSRRNEALAAERDALAKEAADAKAAANRPGADPLPEGRAAANPDEDDDDEDDRESEAESRFNSLVEAEVERLNKRMGEPKLGQLPHHARAIINVATRHPQLHRQVVAEANNDFAGGLPRVFSPDPLAGLELKPKKSKRARRA